MSQAISPSSPIPEVLWPRPGDTSIGAVRGQTKLSKFGNARSGARYGWLAKLPSVSATIASEPNMNATSRVIATTLISSEKRSLQLPPRWRGGMS